MDASSAHQLGPSEPEEEILHHEECEERELDEFSYHCLDCRADTSELNEYYMVADQVWESSGLNKLDGMLCIGCLELRIGRLLTSGDFTSALVNHEVFERSERFMDRLKSDCT